jgi:hypothetical protein
MLYFGWWERSRLNLYDRYDLIPHYGNQTFLLKFKNRFASTSRLPSASRVFITMCSTLRSLESAYAGSFIFDLHRKFLFLDFAAEKINICSMPVSSNFCGFCSSTGKSVDYTGRFLKDESSNFVYLYRKIYALVVCISTKEFVCLMLLQTAVILHHEQ